MPDLVQRCLAAVALVVLAPLILAFAIAVRLDTPGPAFYIAARVGENGRRFGLLKLRSMQQRAAETGPAITTGTDPRITRMGRLLRAARLDELPQLWNVVVGDMRLVGPRPEDPRYVDLADPLHQRVFTARPGITGLAQLIHVDEAALLDPADPDGSYRTAVLPAKLQVDAAYLDHRSPGLDLWIMVQTVRAVLGSPLTAADLARRLGEPALPGSPR